MNRVLFQIIGLIISYLFVFLIIGIAYFLQNRGVSEKTTRKIVHIGVGNWIVLAVFVFYDWYFAIIGPLSFVLLNYLSYRKKIFGKSMELEGEAETPGTVYYAIALTIVVLFFWLVGGGELKWVACLGILVMTWGDGMASVFGERWGAVGAGYTIAGTRKSYIGSLAMLFFAFIALFLTMVAFNVSITDAIYRSAILAVIATIVEGITPYGFDNLTVPILTSFIYYFVFV